MKWFGRKAVRDAGRPFLFAGMAGRLAGEPWPRSYEAQVREAVLSNAVAQRALRLVSESVAGVVVVAETPQATPPSSGRSPSPSPAATGRIEPYLASSARAWVAICASIGTVIAAAVRARETVWRNCSMRGA